MKGTFMSWLDASVITVSVTLVLLLALRPVALAAGLVDRPGGRKTHVGIVPVTGGICMWLGVAIALPLTQPTVPGAAVFLSASGLLLLIGVIDDRFDLLAKTRLIAQICAAAIMCLGADLVAPSLGDILFIGEIRLGVLATPFTVLVAISVINAFNMMDGLDGLAGSMGLAALVPAAFVAGLAGASGCLTLAALLLCSVLAFLTFNFPLPFNRPVRTFMGDAGSTVIGFGVVWIGIEMAHGPEAMISPVTALWLAALPIYDLFISSGRRLRNGQSPMSPDRGHLHHILQEAGLKVGEIVLLMGGAGLIIASIGLGLDALGVHDGVMFVGLIALGLGQAWICSRAHLIARWVGRRRAIESHVVGEPSALRQANTP
jgi:UDP-GlcNAc:undecaprenyl-phosphate GlcNAc-1-phosphate transferase